MRLNKPLVSLLICIFLLTQGDFGFCQESSSTSSEQTKQSATQKSSEKKSITVDKQVIAENMPSHNMRLQQLIKEAQKNIKFLDVEIKNKKVESEVRSHYEKGQMYQRRGDLRKAQKEMKKVVELSKSSQFRKYARREDQRQQRKMSEQSSEAYQSQNRSNKNSQRAAKDTRRSQEGRSSRKETIGKGRKARREKAHTGTKTPAASTNRKRKFRNQSTIKSRT